MTRPSLRSLVPAIALAAIAVSAAKAQVVPPAPPFMSYAAKIVCGTTAADLDVVRGTYASTINIHNPQATIAATFYKKAVIALPERSTTRGAISAFVVDTLKPDQAEGVDCTDVRNLFKGIALPAEFDGFLVLEVPIPPNGGPAPILDVIGKYTVRHRNTAAADPTISDANSLNVVPVQGKLITQ